MANKTVLKKGKNLKSRGSRYFTSGDSRAYLFIHLSKPSNWIMNRVQRTNAYSVKKIYLFIENNYQYGRKKYFSTVVLLFDERIFIDILKNQPPKVNSYREVLQTCSKAVRPCRWKKIQFKRNQHNSSSSLSMKVLRLFWGSWIIVTGPLEILNWRSEMLRMSTPEKEPLGCLNLMVLEDV